MFWVSGMCPPVAHMCSRVDVIQWSPPSAQLSSAHPSFCPLPCPPGNAFTAYGTRMEPLARDLYCHLTGAGVEQRGLCTLRPLMQQQQGPQQQQAGGAWLGGSPDGLTTLAGVWASVLGEAHTVELLRPRQEEPA